MIQHFKKLIKYEVIDPSIWHNKVKDVYEEWEKRYGDFEHYLEVLADVYIEELKGVNKSYIEFIASQVINVNGEMVYKYSRDRIKWHKDNNHKIFFLYLEVQIFLCPKWQKNMVLRNTKVQFI